jgi:hypothetical protein
VLFGYDDVIKDGRPGKQYEADAPAARQLPTTQLDTEQ